MWFGGVLICIALALAQQKGSFITSSNDPGARRCMSVESGTRSSGSGPPKESADASHCIDGHRRKLLKPAERRWQDSGQVSDKVTNVFLTVIWQGDKCINHWFYA